MTTQKKSHNTLAQRHNLLMRAHRLAYSKPAKASDYFHWFKTYRRKLPYEQKEALILHLQGGLMFKQIARLQQVSTNTAWSRYRYALKKLRLQLNSEMME
jgi:DNA-directed RNA polymerase specialized sigma24 family protein